MSLQELLRDCRASGVKIRLDNGVIKLSGAPDAVHIAKARLGPYKANLLMLLTAAPQQRGRYPPKLHSVCLSSIGFTRTCA